MTNCRVDNSKPIEICVLLKNEEDKEKLKTDKYFTLKGGVLVASRSIPRLSTFRELGMGR